MMVGRSAGRCMCMHNNNALGVFSVFFVLLRGHITICARCNDASTTAPPECGASRAHTSRALFRAAHTRLYTQARAFCVPHAERAELAWRNRASARALRRKHETKLREQKRLPIYLFMRVMRVCACALGATCTCTLYTVKLREQMPGRTGGNCSRAPCARIWSASAYL